MTDRSSLSPRAGAHRARFPSLDRRQFLLGCAGLAAIALLQPVEALAQAAPLALTAEQRADIARVEDYLNGITTLRAKFQQYSEGGGVVFGDIYVRRPGRMRVEYAPPVPVILVADGIAVSYYDSELDQLSQLPISSTPVWFLLREEISLTDGVTITNLDKRPGALRLTMHQTDEPEAGSVDLIFGDQPLELRQWTITDAGGKQARIGLFDVRLGGELPNELFKTPRKRGRLGGNN